MLEKIKVKDDKSAMTVIREILNSVDAEKGMESYYTARYEGNKVSLAEMENIEFEIMRMELELLKSKRQFKKGGGVETTDGKDGGELKGKSHEKGGMPVVIANTDGKMIEVEGDEIIINKRSSQCTSCTHTFDGKEMTNKEILSEINQQKGGVPIV
jgi:hypothetical protein